MSDTRQSPSGVLKGGHIDPKWIFNDTEVSAGIDPDSGAPVLVIEDLRTEYGIDVSAVRLRLAPETAKRIGATLLLATDPDLAQRALSALLAPPAKPDRSRHATRGDIPPAVTGRDDPEARAIRERIVHRACEQETANTAAVRSECERLSPGFDWAGATPAERAALYLSSMAPARVVQHQERGKASGYTYGYAEARTMSDTELRDAIVRLESAKPPAFHTGGTVAARSGEGVVTRASAECLAQLSTAELNAQIDAAERGESLNVGMSVHVDGRELPRVARRIVHRRRDGEPASVWTLPPGAGPVVVSVGERTRAELQVLRDGQWVTETTQTLDEIAAASFGADGFSIEDAPARFGTPSDAGWALEAAARNAAPELPAELRGPAEPTAAERAMGWLEDIHGRTR